MSSLKIVFKFSDMAEPGVADIIKALSGSKLHTIDDAQLEPAPTAKVKPPQEAPAKTKPIASKSQNTVAAKVANPLDFDGDDEEGAEDGAEETSITVSDLREAAGQKMADHRDKIAEKLRELGSNTITTLAEKHYETFLSFVKKLK